MSQSKLLRVSVLFSGAILLGFSAAYESDLMFTVGLMYVVTAFLLPVGKD
jgi:hypothetical protein